MPYYRGLSSLMCYLLGVAVVSTAFACTDDRQPQIIDHMSDFERFVTAIKKADTTGSRRTAYAMYYVQRNPKLYTTFIDPDSLDHMDFALITDQLLEHEQIIPRHLEWMRTQIVAATLSTSRIFDFPYHTVPQYLTLNLGRSNAQVRLVNGEVTILYGVDTDAIFGPIHFPTVSRDFRPTVAHELFHAYHWSKNSYMLSRANEFLPPRSSAPLWINVWSEGLANCAARHVYPDADIANVLGMEGIWEESEARFSSMASQLIQDLRRTDPEATSKWLYVKTPSEANGIPSKAGYILGTVVADEVINSVGLKSAVALQGDRLYEAVLVSLRSIAAETVNARTLCQPDKTDSARITRPL